MKGDKSIINDAPKECKKYSVLKKGDKSIMKGLPKECEKMLSTEEGRQKHNKRSAEGMQNILSTDEGRQTHNKRSTERMKQILSTEEGRRRHNESSAKASKKILSTDEGKRKHNKRSAEGMQKTRKSNEYLKDEHLHRRRQRFGDSFSDAADKFKEAINASSSYVCSCCHQTWFQHSVKKVSSLSETSLNTNLLKQVFNRIHFSFELRMDMQHMSV